MKSLRSVLMLVISVALIGCSTPATRGADTSRPSEPVPMIGNGMVVDDIRLGNAIECAPDPDCATRLELAKAAAIVRHGIAPDSIGAARFYMTYIPPGAALGAGGGEVVVFDLEDGSHAAVLTYCMDSCIVVAPQPVQPLTLESPVDHGPLVDPLVKAPRDCASSDHPTCDEALKIAIAAATADRFLAPDAIADAHYYVTYVTPDSPEAAASKAEYIFDFYIAGAHEPQSETAIGVYCGPGPCQVVSSRPTDVPTR